MPGVPLPGPSGGYRMAGVLRTARTRPGTACDQGVDQGVHWREEPDEAGLWMVYVTSRGPWPRCTT